MTTLAFVGMAVFFNSIAQGQYPAAANGRQPTYRAPSTSENSKRATQSRSPKKDASVFERVRSSLGVWRKLGKSKDDSSKSVKGVRSFSSDTSSKKSLFSRFKPPAFRKDSQETGSKSVAGAERLDSYNGQNYRNATAGSTTSHDQRIPLPPQFRYPRDGVSAPLPFRKTQITRPLVNTDSRNYQPVRLPTFDDSPHFGSEITQVSGTQNDNPVVEFLQSLANPDNPEKVKPRGPRVQIPLTGTAEPGTVELTSSNGRISLVVREASINNVLGLIAQQHGLNIVASETVTGVSSVTLTDVLLDDALSAILKINGYTWVREKNILLITRVAGDLAVSPSLSGRKIRVFTLDYVAATDIQKVVLGFLSPIGQAFAIESNSLDKLRTREQVVVEDIPEFLDRIAAYIKEIDVPPRQVLIEAHILQVALKDDTRHGVDFEQLLARIDSSRITFQTQGFTNPAASPAFFLGIDGTDIDAVIEALTTTRDAKTLASPKVLVVNGQEARMQIGAQLGYLVSTTTQTSTVQQVEFLDVGVVLRVTPHITSGNRILMSVLPEVSSGQINETTGLPEEETTEVDTTVLLADGQGMIIGGLIQETDIDSQSKIPFLGDMWLIGRLFQGKTVTRERNEIIIALIPRIVPYNASDRDNELVGLGRAGSRLLDGQLNRLDRRDFEPELADAMRDPRRIAFRRIPHLFKSLREPMPRPLEYYMPSVSERNPWFPGFLYQGTVPFDSFGGQPETVPESTPDAPPE